jgi:hypothetical protein
MRRWLSLLAALLGLGCAEAPPFAACGGTLGCAGSDCIELRYTRLDGSEAGGPFCSNSCLTDAECQALGGTDAVCITLDVEAPVRFFCAARCTAAADCYAGLACTETDDPAVGAVCLP